jgi:hypothetical protein
MRRRQPTAGIAAGDEPPLWRTRSVGIWQGLKEIDMFFQRRDPVHQTMRRVVKRLEKAGLPYAVMGGMAVNFHKYRRVTEDVDILLTREGFAEFQRLFVPKSYGTLPKRTRRFVDKSSSVNLDILVTGLFPGTGKPGPFAFPDPMQVSEIIEKVRVVDLPTLVQLKLAARRWRDFGDVVELIRFMRSTKPSPSGYTRQSAATTLSVWRRNGARTNTKN